MALITLTSDMGLKDYYVAAVKGAIYKEEPTAKVLDISHNIPPFDIAQAAFVLRNTYPDLPDGTINIISVNPEEDEQTEHMVVRYKEQYFISADNGIFALLFDGLPEAIFALAIAQDSNEFTFPTKHVFVKAACHLARGGTPEIIGKKRDSVTQKQNFRAAVDKNVIRGAVIYIDAYGNVITNINRQTFNEVGKGRPYRIFFKREQYSISHIHEQYNDVQEGDKVALFSSSGFLEIAINRGVEGSGGGADQLFGLRMYDLVRVEFDV